MNDFHYACAHFDPSPVIQFGAQWWHRHVCAVGGVFNILTMLTANLIGFVVGTDGISYMIGQLTDNWEGTCDEYGGIPHMELISPNTIPLTGLRFVLFTCFCLFVGVQIMFEYRYVLPRPCRDMNTPKPSHACREEELRAGIVRKC